MRRSQDPAPTNDRQAADLADQLNIFGPVEDALSRHACVALRRFTRPQGLQFRRVGL
jgi:hypothetical protein